MVDIARELNRERIPYVVIGGMAVGVWARPRATTDVDFTLALLPDAAERVLHAIASCVKSWPEDPFGFVKATRMLPFTHKDDVKVDLLFGTIAYTFEAVDRAVTISVRGVPVKFCSPEDLLLQKVVSFRGRDQNDLDELLKSRRKTLDREYLDPRIRELAFILERPEIEERYRKLMGS